MTQGEEPGWAPPGAGPPADETGQPPPPGTGGSPWPALPPDAAGASRPEGLAVVALVLAVVSLLVPVLPGVVAFVLAVVAARRARRAPGAAVSGRGLVTAALVVSTIGLLVWTGLGALAVMTRQEPAGWQAATAAGTATATVGAGQFSQVTAPPPTEPPATEPPATEPPATEPPAMPPKAAGRIGDRLTVYDPSGTALLEIIVTKVRFSGGDEFWQPEHGLYMGAYVKVHALADEQDSPWGSSYVLAGGNRYEEIPIIDLNEFTPYMDPVILSQDERASGWLVFDVPTRHGQLVLRDILNERNLGIWKY